MYCVLIRRIFVFSHCVRSIANVGNYSGRFVVLPHAQFPSLQPTRVNRSFTKYEAVYNVSMLGLPVLLTATHGTEKDVAFWQYQ